jgi:hypothetical protein
MIELQNVTLNTMECSERNKRSLLHMVVHACNFNPWEVEVVKPKFKASLDYIMKPCFKKNATLLLFYKFKKQSNILFHLRGFWYFSWTYKTKGMHLRIALSGDSRIPCDWLVFDLGNMYTSLFYYFPLNDALIFPNMVFNACYDSR